VDPKLVTFAATLDWLKRQGIEVERYNLAQQPAAFMSVELVKTKLQKEGDACLPMILVEGQVVFQGSYPLREELAKAVGLEVPESIYTDAVRELVALGAAIASNCEPCFRAHYDAARKLGVSKEDMRLAVDTALAVKAKPAGAMEAMADKYLKGSEENSRTQILDPASLTWMHTKRS
jgi:AhpD family alkylhydroperoxidase